MPKKRTPSKKVTTKKSVVKATKEKNSGDKSKECASSKTVGVKEHVLEAFKKCQEPRYNLDKLAEVLKTYYEQVSENSKHRIEFVQTFKHCVECGLQTKNRDSAAEKFMQFISVFGVLFADVGSSEEKEEEKDEEYENFYNSLLKLIVSEKYHNHKDKTVRFRVCQLVRLLLGAAPTDASLDDEVATLCTKALLQRIDDKVPVVRAQAVRALVRLQQPSMKNCPVISAFLFHLSCDESAVVRIATLSCISFTVKTLPEILERVRDVAESIRKLTYETIAQKVSITALTNYKRMYLILQGLSDSSRLVRKTVQTHLLQSWLTEMKDDMVALIKLLDIIGAYDETKLAICALLQSQQLDAVSKFKLLDNQHVIPIDKVCPESIGYWHILCEYLRSKGSDLLLDELLPSTFQYAEYIESYFDKYLTPFLGMNEEQLADEKTDDDRIEKEFVAEQMFKMANSLEYSDAAGHRKMDDVITKIISKTNIMIFPNFFPALAKLYITVHFSRVSETDSIAVVAKMISELRIPPSDETNETTDELMETEDNQPTQMDEQKLREMRLQKARITVKIHEAQDQLDMLIEDKKYTDAEECQKDIDDLKDECRQIETKIVNFVNPGSVARKKKDILSDMTEKNQEKSDDNTMFKCLRLVTELASELFVARCSQVSTSSKKFVTGIHSTFLGWIDSIILPCFYHETPAVRQEAVRTLGTCCLYSSQLASCHFSIFMKAAEVDMYMIRAEAINVICDLIRFFGCKSLLKESQEASGEEYDDESCKRKLLDKFLEMMNNEEADIREASVNLLVRVHVSHQIISPMVACRLILHWVNPLTKNDRQIFDLISKFLDTFPNMSQESHECMQAAFLPTMRTLFDAPPSSPYASVKINSVVDLFIAITRPCLIKEAQKKNLKKKNWLKEGSAHDNFAVMIANEVLAEPTSFHVSSLCRALPSLELDHELKDNIKDLHVLAENLLEVVKDKAAIRYIKEFRRKLPKVVINSSPSSDEMNTTTFIHPSTLPSSDEIAVSASPSLKQKGGNTMMDNNNSNMDDSSTQQQQNNNNVSSTSQMSNYLRTPKKKRRRSFVESPLRKTPGQIFLRPRSTFENNKSQQAVDSNK